MQSAETSRELVSYNFMQCLRKKLNRPRLCILDLNKKQREVFRRLVNEYLDKGKYCNNPFEDNRRLLMIELEKSLDIW